MNSHDTRLLRITGVAYSDDVSALAGVTRPNPRVISKYSLSTIKFNSDP